MFAAVAGQVADTVTVRDGKRFARPLAVPRSCPLYVRDHGTCRTHDRMLRWLALVGPNVCPNRSGCIFSQVSVVLANSAPAGGEGPDAG
jgi:hypothetical protein